MFAAALSQTIPCAAGLLSRYISSEELSRVDAIFSVREPPAKRWKGSHVGAIWGWEPYSGTATRRSSLMEASPEPMPHEIGQSHCSPATGRSEAYRL